MRIGIMVSLFMVLSVFVKTNGSDQIPEKVYAGNVFDNAEDWAPLKLLSAKAYTYYKVTITKNQQLTMHSFSYNDPNDAGGANDSWIRATIYNSDASVVQNLESDGNKINNAWKLYAGTYYVYFEYDKEMIYYDLSEEIFETDLTIMSNISGTIFENSLEWQPLTTVNAKKDTDSFFECFKFVLSQRKKIEFRFDGEYDGWGANSYFKLFNSHGLKFTCNKDGSVNLDKGTYFLATYHVPKNFYYVLSPSDQATGININTKSLNMTIGQEAKLSYSLEPDDCVDTVNWTSGDTSIATVDDGKVTATGTGQCLINATTTSGKVASCVVTVIKPTFTITLKDGDSVIETKKLEMDKTYGSLPQLKKKGYLFTGWFADKNGKEEVSSGTTAKKNTTIYAGWEKVTVEKPVIRYKTSKAKSITVDWNLVYGVKGYELRYSTKSNMKKAKKISVSVNQKTIKKLKTKKKYYLQVRAYKMDSTGEKVYSAWSKKENIKTKK